MKEQLSTTQVKETKRENDRGEGPKEIKSTRSAVFIRPHYSGKA